MPDPPSSVIPRPALLQPQVRLWGDVNDDMLGSFHAQIGAAVGAGPLVIELTTNGGDAEMGRRLAMEIRLLHERLGRRIVFLGATAVYSAGVSIMAAFPRVDRVLTADAVLLIHRRRLSETVDLHGSLSVCEQKARELLTQIKIGRELERKGFAELIAGSKIGMKEAVRRADRNWYMTADEALERGLIAAVLEPGPVTETEPAASDVRSTSLTPPGSVLGGPRASA